MGVFSLDIHEYLTILVQSTLNFYVKHTHNLHRLDYV